MITDVTATFEGEGELTYDVDSGARAGSAELLKALNDESLPVGVRLDAARSIHRLLEEAKCHVSRTVDVIAEQHRSDDDVLAIMYWEYEDLVQASVLGMYCDIKDIVAARSPWTHPCTECGTEIPITSRSALKSANAAAQKKRIPGCRPMPLCNACSTAYNGSRQAEHLRRAEAYRERVQQLRKMPYAEYLQSPEWQERRKARLKVARYRCQVCNAGDRTLNVHHRTYVRRGEEFARDLIVLCQPCHHLFHRNGSLAPHPD